MELISVSSVSVYESQSNGVNWMHQQIHVHWSGHACAVWGLACVSKWQQAHKMLYSAMKSTIWSQEAADIVIIKPNTQFAMKTLFIVHLQQIASVNTLAVSTR